MPGMPDKGRRGTSSIISNVYEKRSNLIKIILAAAGKKKIPVSLPHDDDSVCNTLSISWMQQTAVYLRNLLTELYLVNDAAPP